MSVSVIGALLSSRALSENHEGRTRLRATIVRVCGNLTLAACYERVSIRTMRRWVSAAHLKEFARLERQAAK